MMKQLCLALGAFFCLSVSNTVLAGKGSSLCGSTSEPVANYKLNIKNAHVVGNQDYVLDATVGERASVALQLMATPAPSGDDRDYYWQSYLDVNLVYRLVVSFGDVEPDYALYQLPLTSGGYVVPGKKWSEIPLEVCSQ